MIGAYKKTTSRLAVAAAAGLFAGGVALVPGDASAADLGGDCCADLEERVAELEATTVRKGNRKVTLKLSGQVNRSLLFWDDGNESDVYSLDNSVSNTRFRFTGEATIRPGWRAGYHIEYSTTTTSTTSCVDQTSPSVCFVNSNNPGAGALGTGSIFGAVAPATSDSQTGFAIRHTVWWMDWERFGRVWVGHHSSATDNLIYLNLGNGDAGQGGHDVALVGGGFFLTRSNISGNPGNLISPVFWRDLLPDFDVSNRFDLVRYDSPDILGCVFSAAWGEDDVWDVAARCKKELNSVKLLWGVGYKEIRGNEGGIIGTAASFGLPAGILNGGLTAAAGQEIAYEDFIMAGSILHDPTGLYFNAVYTRRSFSAAQGFSVGLQVGAVTGRPNQPDNENFYLQAGIYRRWNDLGKTTIYVDWRHSEDAFVGTYAGAFRNNGVFPLSEVTDTEADAYGFGVVQQIDNAAMEVFLDYKHFQADIQTCVGSGAAFFTGCAQFFNEQIDDFDRVHMGGRIRF